VVTFGDSEHKQVTVRTHFADPRGEIYDLREPVEPEEIGQLYRLFFQERFPKTVSEMDRYLIVADAADRVIGGLCYRMENPETAHLDGVVVNASVTGRGIATALLEDFATRMASRGVKVLRTGFIMRRFCERRGFRLDRRWGGLVRLLTDEARNSDDPGEAPMAL
jgi:GNAT superfamily N-acetyltransferase